MRTRVSGKPIEGSTELSRLPTLNPLDSVRGRMVPYFVGTNDHGSGDPRK